MMAVRKEFEVRAAEVAGYFTFLEKVASDDATLNFTDKSGKPCSEAVDKDVLKTVKATGFLLLYNLVESTMTNAISAIFDELKEKKVTFDMVREELKKIAFKNLRNGRADVHGFINDVSVDILTAAFDRKALFSGNLDARKIRETASQYGFSADTNQQLTRGGVELLTIKTNRNDLGHGDKSFSEVGREHDAGELVKIKGETIAYLSEILTNVEHYIREKHYLATVPSSMKQQAAIEPSTAMGASVAG